MTMKIPHLTPVAVSSITGTLADATMMVSDTIVGSDAYDHKIQIGFMTSNNSNSVDVVAFPSVGSGYAQADSANHIFLDNITCVQSATHHSEIISIGDKLNGIGVPPEYSIGVYNKHGASINSLSAVLTIPTVVNS